jgi:hypothetical protein
MKGFWLNLLLVQMMFILAVQVSSIGSALAEEEPPVPTFCKIQSNPPHPPVCKQVIPCPFWWLGERCDWNFQKNPAGVCECM